MNEMSNPLKDSTKPDLLMLQLKRRGNLHQPMHRIGQEPKVAPIGHQVGQEPINQSHSVVNSGGSSNQRLSPEVMSTDHFGPMR